MYTNAENQQIYTREEIEKMKEQGLYNTDGTFRSDRQIKRDMALRGELPTLQRLSPVAQPKEIDDYLRAAEERSSQMKELSQKSENEIKVFLPRTSNIHIMGDLHIGNPNTDYRRIRQEIEAIKNSPDEYIFFAGDLVDGIFWGGAGGAEQSLNLNEQFGALRSLFKGLGDKIIGAVSGEHDSKWSNKTGSDPYDILTEETGAPYVRGIAEVSLEVGDQDYTMVVSHKAKGHSMYNKNHPTFRQARFNLQGADIYASAHTHQKQVSQEAIREIGKARQVTHISVGPYKSGDEYGQRSGYPEQKKEEMFGATVRLHADQKRVEVEPDILFAIKKWGWQQMKEIKNVNLYWLQESKKNIQTSLD